MGALLLILLATALVAAVAIPILVHVRARRRGESDPASTLRVARIVAIGYGVLITISTIIAVISALTHDEVSVSMPVRSFWPSTAPGVDDIQGPTATVVSGGFERADVIVAGLDLPTRLMLGAGHLLQGITAALIAAAIAILCTRLLAGSPFRPVVSRLMTIAAATVTAGGLAWQICFEAAGVRASAQVLTVTGWRTDEASGGDLEMGTGWPEPTFGFTLEFWPIYFGFALVALAAAFRHGERLQRDSEGLV